MDTGTVRLVIFLGMFLVFAGDYTALMSSIFGINADKNGTTSLTKRPQSSPKDSPRGQPLPEEKIFMEENGISAKAKLMSTIKSSCLPKLICELTASTNQDQLSEMERSLLNLIRDTSLSTTAEVASRYHFAAHMGQLISGLEGQGCHNFYPTCPFPGSTVLSLMKKVRIR
ncbi:uncharacterized protein LOC107228209 [Neodiprion lecontei]|uniref:Uncharacterized protein LOC107228209 n=1 Tax=Neodiprion lecontei TaxID=441921 RepID=A0ABM3G7H9_NEOLC|nr:uncharacterized protein LOC107228209 [Neodiprion lecontei]